MEIELKYQINDEFTRDRLMQDSYISEIASGEEETLDMHAVYFDTESKDLRQAKITFRVRRENDKCLATVKWDGKSNGGLHIRNELNLNVEPKFIDDPSADAFNDSPIGEKLANIINGKKLEKVMEMDFVRKQILIDTGKSVSELSVDYGTIKTSKGEAPISEMEIELYSGDQDDFVALGEKLKTKYNLEASDISKFKRGLQILEK